MTITALPTAPARSDPPATFIARADALMAALSTLVSEVNAATLAMNLNATSDTSASSVAIGTGAKSFTVSAGKSFLGGMFLVIADTAAPSTNWMFGQVTSYGGTALVMNVTAVGGSGTKSAWTISQSATGVAGGGVVAGLGANTFTGVQRWAKGADVASAGALTLGTDGNYFDITGTTSITSIATAGVGTRARLHFDAALTLTHHATDLILPGGANITTAAGDEAEFIEYATGDWRCVSYTRANGVAPVPRDIQPISASVGSNALTISAGALTLDFRSATIGSGAVATVSGTPANLVVSSGSTLGTVSGQQSRLAVLALNNAGTLELAVVNLAGGTALGESGVISTTAEGGAGAADSASVVYSTTARSNLAYRVIGFIESTQATAGTWATAPSTIQGAGGNAMTALDSIGFGQTWQNVTGSRALSTTYYNTTGRPILVSIATGANTGISSVLTVNGLAVSTQFAAAGTTHTSVSIVPPGGSYSITATSLSNWFELR